MKIIQEFKEFAIKGSVVDLAIGVIIGGALGKIVSSLVNDIIMPPISLLFGKINFATLFINLSSTHYATLADAQKAGAPTINYGLFISAIIEFLIIAWVIFIMVKQINRLKAATTPPKTAEVTTKTCTFCYSTIPLKATRCPNCTSALNPKKALKI